MAGKSLLRNRSDGFAVGGRDWNKGQFFRRESSKVFRRDLTPLKDLHRDPIAGDRIDDFGQRSATIAPGLALSKLRENPESSPTGALGEFEVEETLMKKAGAKLLKLERDGAGRFARKQLRLLGLATAQEWTGDAIRFSRSAKIRAEVHQRRGDSPALMVRIKTFSNEPEGFFSLSGVYGNAEVGPTGEDSNDIGVEDDRMEIIGEGPDGGGRVGSDTG